MLFQDWIILGFTGPLGSGCSYIAKAIAQKQNCAYYKLSSVIKERTPKDLHSDVQALQNKGNELRRNEGDAVLVTETFKKITSDNSANGGKCVVIDGIKHAQEVQALRMAANFFLFSIQANTGTRKKRLVGDRLTNDTEFEIADTRDQLEDDPNGQQVKKCDYLSDIIILNEENIVETASRKKDDFINDIWWKYVKPITEYAESRAGLEIAPSIDELCMTMAFSISKMSSCLKRKVGAIIVQENTLKDYEHAEEQNGQLHVKMPNIVSSGYNDVPLGQPKCIYHPDFRGCYRDHLQKKHAAKLKWCPKCGEKISGNLTKDYKCKKCETDIFKEFVPGAKHAPGKLLDMCRALHAEEVSLCPSNNRKF